MSLTKAQYQVLIQIQRAIINETPDTNPVFMHWIEQAASESSAKSGQTPHVPLPEPIPDGASPECELCYLQAEAWYVLGIAICLSLGPSEQQACINTVHAYYLIQLESCPCGES